MKKTTAILAAAMASSMAPQPAQAQTDNRLLGEIIMVGMTFCPRGTMEADGRLLAISGNTALFSLLGTTYGGDGRTSFALPDLRGRAPIGQGQGPGLEPRRQGQKAGTDSVTYGSQTPEGTAQTATRGQPFLAIRYCVVTQGIYPSRS